MSGMKCGMGEHSNRKAHLNIKPTRKDILSTKQSTTATTEKKMEKVKNLLRGCVCCVMIYEDKHNSD